MDWKGAILDAFDALGPGSLAALSFSEAIIQPVPPDLLYMPMLLATGGDATAMIWLWLVVSITSVAGSVVGHWIGARWGSILLDRYAKPSHVETLHDLFERHGQLGIFIAACSPIPYKVFGWFAGMAEMELKPFVLAGLAGRGLRFGLEALAIWFWGDVALQAAEKFVENEFLVGALCLLLMGGGLWWWMRAQPDLA